MPYLTYVLRHLSVFEAVVETGQIQRAAARLNIDQSAVSRRMLTMERELGVKLFERRSTGARLTVGGEIFHAAITKSLVDIETAIDSAKRATFGQTGSLTIGFVDTAARGPLLSGSLTAVQRTFPDVVLKLKAMPAMGLVEALKSGEVEAGFLHDAIEKVRGLEYRKIWVYEQALALYKGHPLAKRHALTLADMHGENFIWPNRSRAPLMYDQLAASFNRAGPVRRARSFEVETSESMLNLVSSGLGIGFVHFANREVIPKNVVLRRLADFSPTVNLFLVWQKRSRSAVLPHFVKLVLEEAATEGKRRTKSID